MACRQHAAVIAIAVAIAIAMAIAIYVPEAVQALSQIHLARINAMSTMRLSPQHLALFS
jgi:hypothetical protein